MYFGDMSCSKGVKTKLIALKKYLLDGLRQNGGAKIYLKFLLV